MSNEVATITASINTRTAAVLGSSYSELAFLNEIEKNNFKGANQRYGTQALAISSAEEKGVLGSFTVDQVFEISLTDFYASEQTGDSDRINKGIALLDQALLIYKDLINNRAGSPSIVIKTGDVSTSDPEYLTEDNVVVIKMQVLVTYRKQL